MCPPPHARSFRLTTGPPLLRPKHRPPIHVMPRDRQVHEHKGQAGSLKFWSTLQSGRSTQFRLGSVQEFHPPAETNPLQQGIAPPNRVPSRCFAHLARQRAARFFSFDFHLRCPVRAIQTRNGRDGSLSRPSSARPAVAPYHLTLSALPDDACAEIACARWFTRQRKCGVNRMPFTTREIESPDPVTRVAAADAKLHHADDDIGEKMVLNMGPSHPATHGVLRLGLEIDGGNITKTTPDIRFFHRGDEKKSGNKQ